MIHHKRGIEDENDEQLVCTGWKMIGLSLWRHPKFGKFNFRKDDALEADVSNFHVIEMEHYKMLEFIQYMLTSNFKSKSTSNECERSANKLLTEMKYI